MTKTGRYITVLALMLPWGLESARGEALSTTSVGFASRSITFTSAKKSLTEQTDPGAAAATGTQTESLADPILCQRVSTPSSLGLELGAGGCVHGGGFWTLAHTISAHLQLIYYPLASRTTITGDASVQLERQIFGDFYLIGQGGFAKITHGQNQSTNLTFSMDVLEFGGGIGWSYRMFRNVAIGVEGNYLVGSILSSATTGSTSVFQGAASITVFL